MASPLFVKVTVHEAKDIIAADLNGFSDPYCVLTVGTAQAKTTVKNKTLDPVWNESFEFDFTNNKQLIITMWDKDVVSADDFLGQCVVDITQVNLGGAAVWRTLQPRPGKNDKVKGVLRLSFTQTTNGAVAGTETIELEKVGASSTVKSRVQQAKKAGLTVLDLSGCDLKDLPTIVVESPVWTSLDLGFNKLGAYPESLMLCANTLTELFLSGNQITSLTKGIGALVNLKTLYLNGNFITSLPPEIGLLSNLEKLDISNNGLRSLPPEIGKLTRLEELNLSGSKFVEGLPPEIGHLDFLVTLHLNACELRELPREIANLDRLLELDVGTNYLTQLPNEIGNLTRLVTLNLSDNQLTDLPLSMGRCLKLDQCQLERNPIKNEELLRKYRIGTDHLVDYLEKRLFAFEQEQKRRKKKAKRPPMPKPANTVGTLENPEEVIINKQSDEIDDSLPYEEKMIRKKFNSQQVAHKTRLDLIELKKLLMNAQTIEDAVPIAQAIRDLKQICEEARAHILPCERPKPPPLFPNETKLQQLKKVTMVAMKEVETVVSGMTNTLSAKITFEQIEILSTLITQVSERLYSTLSELKPNFNK